MKKRSMNALIQGWKLIDVDGTMPPHAMSPDKSPVNLVEKLLPLGSSFPLFKNQSLLENYCFS
ncbi:hypothetical protein [Cecembia rubra]|uniref:hypothetical protein n=1 Tax=Cecembia rubra TaxID=1485585 RepID=UPI0011B213D2|nr:hypothetical protein [Cecembia rubra]